MNDLRQSFTTLLQAALAGEQVAYLDVGEEEAGQRIDNYLIRLAKGVPKSHIYRILRSGEVRVNKGRIDATYRLQEGDKVRIPPMRVAQPSEEAVAMKARVPDENFTILHEDSHLLIIDKPCGVAVHGGSGVAFGVIEQLRKARPNAKFLELVHRLDRETSGVLLLAKKRSALVNLHAQMRDNQTDKRYLLCVKGNWQEKRRHLKFPLHKYVTAEGERRVRVQADGQESYTMMDLKESFNGYTLLEAHLKTGRTHQIRVHAAHAGYPIVGDDKYGDFPLNKALARPKSNPGFKRMFLHAHQIRFTHPETGIPMTINAPLPSECTHFLEQLRVHLTAPTSTNGQEES